MGIDLLKAATDSDAATEFNPFVRDLRLAKD